MQIVHYFYYNNSHYSYNTFLLILIFTLVFYGKNRKVYLLLTSVPLINVAESEPNREEAIASLKKIRRKALDLIDEDLI